MFSFQFPARFIAPAFERPLWLLVLLTLLLGLLAYQVPFAFNLIGESDAPLFVRGFFPPETSSGVTYRWTKKELRVDLPSIGTGVPLLLRLRANGVRLEGQTPPIAHLTMDGIPIADVRMSGDWDNYRYDLPATRDPNHLRLEISMTPFSPPGDSRKLGIAITELFIEPGNTAGLTLPAPELMVRFLFALGLIYFITRRLGFSMRVGFWVGTVFALIGAALIAFARPYVGEFSSILIWIVVADYALLIIMTPTIRTLFARGGVSVGMTEARWMGTLFLLGLSVRLIAILYPGDIVGDSLFHLHRLQWVMTGQVIFSSGQGAVGFERPIPYPPALYLILSPLITLFGDDLAVLKFFVAWVDTTVTLAIYYIVRRAGGSARAAWFAMAVALALPISYLIFSWAIYANMMAQACVVLALAIWVSYDGRVSYKGLAILVFVLTVALLSHVTMVPLLAVFFCIGLLFLWFSRGANPLRRVVRPALSLALAVLLAFVLYYSDFVSLMTTSSLQVVEARSSRGTSADVPLGVAGGGVKDPRNGLYRVRVYSLSEWVMEGSAGLGREAWAYYRIWPLIFAPIGFVLLSRRATSRSLAALGWAGLATGLLFALGGLVLDVYVRYPLFMLPFVAIGSGVALDALMARGRLLIFGVALLLAAAVIDSLLIWIRFF